MQIFQILMGGMNFRERSQKNQTSLAVRSALVWGFDFAALFLNLTGGYNVKQRSVPWWCACRSRGCHLGISVKPISSRRGRLCPPHYYRHPRISDLSTALDGVPVVLWCKHRGGPNEHPGGLLYYVWSATLVRSGPENERTQRTTYLDSVEIKV